VRSLLMGDQGCVLYGAAEFSRDTDVVVLSDDDNLDRLGSAVGELRADVIAVPPFEKRHLEAGHSVHFRCHAAGVEGMRLDVMARIRGLPGFDPLWERRSTIETDDGPIDVLALPDLVTAKKTQRDKDWPMIRRLVEAHYFENQKRPTPPQIRFWFQELRTSELLLELAQRHPATCRRLTSKRPLLSQVISGESMNLEQALLAEETAERQRDREYWLPLRRELEALRHAV